jgi:hypothetical protein
VASPTSTAAPRSRSATVFRQSSPSPCRDNYASRRVMEKCGMSFVGVVDVYGPRQVKYTVAR